MLNKQLLNDTFISIFISDALCAYKIIAPMILLIIYNFYFNIIIIINALKQ